MCRQSSLPRGCDLEVANVECRIRVDGFDGCRAIEPGANRDCGRRMIGLVWLELGRDGRLHGMELRIYYHDLGGVTLGLRRLEGPQNTERRQ